MNAPQPVSLRTDAEKLREVLLNLLHNAVEYNQPGGKVELNGATAAQRVFAVSDTGIGMTDDVKNRIFERFYRADPSRTATASTRVGVGDRQGMRRTPRRPHQRRERARRRHPIPG